MLTVVCKAVSAAFTSVCVHHRMRRPVCFEFRLRTKAVSCFYLISPENRQRIASTQRYKNHKMFMSGNCTGRDTHDSFGTTSIHTCLVGNFFWATPAPLLLTLLKIFCVETMVKRACRFLFLFSTSVSVPRWKKSSVANSSDRLQLFSRAKCRPKNWFLLFFHCLSFRLMLQQTNIFGNRTSERMALREVFSAPRCWVWHSCWVHEK